MIQSALSLLSRSRVGRSSAWLHTAAAAKAQHDFRVRTDADGMKVLSPDATQGLSLNYTWLRDHCRCESCYNATTHQRRLQPDEIPRLEAAEISANVADGRLNVRWPDRHVSHYDLQWLREVWAPRDERERLGSLGSGCGCRTEAHTWGGTELKAAGGLGKVRHSMADVMAEGGEKAVLRDLLRFGLALVDGVSKDDPEETRQVSEKVAPLEQTMYGEFWVIDPSSADNAKELETFADTAYTTEGIGSHTDSTYYRNTPGVQVFHIMHASKSGGDNIFVDGFRVIEELQKKDPKAFTFLSSTSIRHHYLGPGQRVECDESIIKLHPQTGKVVQLRYNPYDRAPLINLTPSQVKQFYTSYRALQSIVKSSAMEFWVSLQPGQVLFVDNWRCTHGRSAFKGKRTLCGCYLSRDDLLSKCRALGL